MSDFSELEQAFFRAGDSLATMTESYVAAEDVPKGWLSRLFRPQIGSWDQPMPMPLPLPEASAYASYELEYASFGDDAYFSYEMAA